VLDAAASEAGMHLVASMGPRCGTDDKTASQRLAEAGIIAPALSEYFAGTAFSEGLVLGYAGLTERDMTTAMRNAAAVLVSPRS